MPDRYSRQPTERISGKDDGEKARTRKGYMLLFGV